MGVNWSLLRSYATVAVAFAGLTLIAPAAGEDSGPLKKGTPEEKQPLPGLVPSPRAFPGVGRWQLAHKWPSGRIYSIAWSPDGKKVAYSELSYVRIADAKTLETERVFVGHSSRVTSIDWNHATDRIASASYDGTVRLWSALGVPARVFQGHTREVTAVAWTKDGKRLASASLDGTVRIWNAGGALEHNFVVSSPVSSLAWSPDGSRLLSGDDRNQIRMWQVGAGTSSVIEGQLGPVSALAWRPDGKQFASATWGMVEDGKRVVDLRLWNPDGSLVDSAIGDKSIYALQWSPDGHTLAVSYEDAVLQLQAGATKVNSRTQFQLLEGRTAETPVAWSPNGKELALGGSGSLMVVDASDPSKSRCYPPVPRKRKQFIGFNAMDPTCSRLVLSVPEAADRLVVMNLVTGAITPIPEELSRVLISEESFSPDGKRIAVVVNQDRLSIWTIEKEAPDVVVHSEERIFDCAWSRGDDRIAYRDGKGTIHIVKPDGTKLAELTLPKGAAARVPVRQSRSDFRFSNDGQAIFARYGNAVEGRRVSGGDPVTIEFGMPFFEGWVSSDLERAAATQQVNTEEHLLRSWSSGGSGAKDVSLSKDVDYVSCSPDARWAIVGHDSGIWELIRLDDPSVWRHEELASVNGSCMAAVFSSDSRHFATAGWDGLIKIWRVDGTLERTLAGGDNNPLYRLYWSFDGKHLVSNSREGMMCRFSADDGKVESFMFRTQSSKLLHISHDGNIAENDRSLAADDLNALLEEPDGSMRIVDYPEFLKRTGQTVP